ncbi:MAG: arginine repressor [Clostridia bacterium]|nr:arginine repressor [Clostridia bacterium]MBR4457821.1 arginine repressor [Clostridia bacterium]
MKSRRQTAILEIIEQQEIDTQEGLAAALAARGMQVTQATVSRDIKELRLTKLPTQSGGYRYAAPQSSDRSISDRLHRMLRESLISVAVSENLIVVRTLSGSANVAAEAMDSLGWPELLGTVAGDNTVLAVIRSAQESPEIERRLRELMR